MNIHPIALLLLCACLTGCGAEFDTTYAGPEAQRRQTSDWISYGGAGGRKYAEQGELSKSNVAGLEVAWIYRSGDVSTVFQSTPITFDGQLIFCTPFNNVISLDPLTGRPLWRFDAGLQRHARIGNEYNCRGLSSWTGAGGDDGHCARRIFTATNDARLIALDSRSGARCPQFGNAGEVDLSKGVGEIWWPGEYQVTSPPAVAGNVVVVGSAISDGSRVEAPSGVVRGFDAVSGGLLWAFDLAPPDFDYATRAVSDAGYALGTPNVWSAMTVDAKLGLVYLPTGNPSPDYDRSANPDLDHFGSSVVALDAASGKVVWHFNTVINDLWDFDVPSQPVLADIELHGETVPVVIQSTKMGFVFVLNRKTGEPVVPVEYRQVPVHGPLQAQLSAVQPFPPPAFQVSRNYEHGGSLLGLCNGMDEESVIGPVYTPITEQWTVGLPSNMGATNWGGVAVDPRRGLIAVHTNSVPFRTRLIARAQAADLLAAMEDAAGDAERAAARQQLRQRFDLPDNVEVAQQRGVDYLMARHMYRDPYVGAPCSGLPMAEMMVIDIANSKQLWRRPHGSLRDFAGLPVDVGVPGLGGPLITASGLVFIAGAAEKAIRAYDLDTGDELWHHRLPHPGNATPMTYTVSSEGRERQFVVIAAGGDARGGVGGVGDYLVAFALPQSGG